VTASSRRNISLKLRLAGVCGIMGSVFPLVMVLSATSLSSWFSWNVNALSELGVGEESALFNSAVFLGGVLNLVFAIGLRQYFNKKQLLKAGVISIMLSSISLALVGIFAINCLAMHAIAAFGYFMLAPIGFLLIGFGTKQGTIKKLSIACGTAALLAIIVLPTIIFGLSIKVGFAVPELVEALIIATWTLFMAAKLLSQQN
jgi:hypothetical membrane protein